MLGVSFAPLWISSTDCVRRMAGDTRTITSILAGSAGDSSTIASNSIPLEPGFEVESLFWISSLASPDPVWILPMAYGVIATYGVWLRVRTSFTQQAESPDVAQWILDKFYKSVSLLMFGGPIYMTQLMIRSDFPSAVVLYLITVSSTFLLQRPLIMRFVGSAKNIRPLLRKMAKPKGGREK